ncbi:MAG: MFS transporter [Thioclava sp.]|nr:MFS transporter [Thioclava sp.]
MQGRIPLVFQGFAEPIRIKAPVGEQPVGLGQAPQQRSSAGVVADLARSHEDLEWAALGVRDSMQLGVQPPLVLPIRRPRPPFSTAGSMGLPLVLVPLALVVLNIDYSLSASPVGPLPDGTNGIAILIVGLAFLVARDLRLAFAPGFWGVMAGVALWGLHMGFTQGVLSFLIADSAPPELRGTAFGIFNLVTAVALLAASVIAGGLWIPMVRGGGSLLAPCLRVRPLRD